MCMQGQSSGWAWHRAALTRSLASVFISEINFIRRLFYWLLLSIRWLSKIDCGISRYVNAHPRRAGAINSKWLSDLRMRILRVTWSCSGLGTQCQRTKCQQTEWQRMECQHGQNASGTECKWYKMQARRKISSVNALSCVKCVSAFVIL